MVRLSVTLGSVAGPGRRRSSPAPLAPQRLCPAVDRTSRAVSCGRGGLACGRTAAVWETPAVGPSRPPRADGVPTLRRQLSDGGRFTARRRVAQADAAARGAAIIESEESHAAPCSMRRYRRWSSGKGVAVFEALVRPIRCCCSRSTRSMPRRPGRARRRAAAINDVAGLRLDPHSGLVAEAARDVIDALARTIL